MTAVALGAETVEVHVIDFVAADTCSLSLFKITAAVTLIAGDIGVGTMQGKFCLTVVEYRFAPAVGGMTVTALFSLAALVHIILLMAGDTLLRRVTHFLAVGMTLFAGHL